ncbi:MAG: hypothetical protein IJH79_07250 [Lentisphaeria bacterium]|nr:hypothetical protein [Lentisphaeria bacterium]MBQ7206731.1 hypothetical protein [Lentisphaeria bacterium]
MRKAKGKVSYEQALETYFSQMSDKEFVRTFEEIHKIDISENYTAMQQKFLPFFEANLDEEAYCELQDDYESGCADLEPLLEEHPELIALLPIHELWSLDPWERLMLLIRCPEEAVVVKQTLEGNDIWATTLPMLAQAIQKKAADLCPWETLTAYQKRYMALKSSTLKKIISGL